MTDTNRATSIEQWTSVQAYTLAVICLLVGIASGWFIHGSQSPAPAAPETANTSAPAVDNANAGAQTPTPAQMQKMAETQAGPLLEKLKADPTNAGSETVTYCASTGLVAGLTMSNQTMPATTGEDDRMTVSFATRCSVPFTLRQARRYIRCSG